VGKPLRHFGDGLMLLDWDFIDDDKHIQFSSSQTHGPGTDWLTMEVQVLETGRLLKRWLQRSDTADTQVPLASIRGRVTDGGGVALADTVVSIRAHPAAEPFALTISTEGGQFTLQGISPGQHELRFEHLRFKTRAIKVTVGPAVESMDAGAVTLQNQPGPEK
jgi:protocatechuate 3,4-dioxygenase beta subunit